MTSCWTRTFLCLTGTILEKSHRTAGEKVDLWQKKLIKDILEIDLVFAMSLLGINCKLHSLGHLYIQIFKKEEIN